MTLYEKVLAIREQQKVINRSISTRYEKFLTGVGTDGVYIARETGKTKANEQVNEIKLEEATYIILSLIRIFGEDNIKNTEEKVRLTITSRQTE